ncbi:MAG: hypothetical protein AB4290_24915 [Spirulina sp.]
MLPLTAAEIIKLVFETAIATGATKATEGAIAQAKTLWDMIKARFQGRSQLKKALEQAETEQSYEILEAEIVSPLEAEMKSDREFAEELQAIAQQITNIQTQTNIEEQINIEEQTNIKKQTNRDVENVVTVQKARDINF